MCLCTRDNNTQEHHHHYRLILRLKRLWILLWGNSWDWKMGVTVQVSDSEGRWIRVGRFFIRYLFPESHLYFKHSMLLSLPTCRRLGICVKETSTSCIPWVMLAFWWQTQELAFLRLRDGQVLLLLNKDHMDTKVQGGTHAGARTFKQAPFPPQLRGKWEEAPSQEAGVRTESPVTS